MGMRFLIALLFALSAAGAASAQTLSERVERELELNAAAVLPAAASVRISEMTPVRGEVKTIDILRYDPISGYFEARVGNGRVQKTVSGRAQARTAVYAPIRALSAGDIVEEADFIQVSAPLASLPKDAVFDLSTVVGHEARRSLAANRPLSSRWLGPPIVVRKNSIVTMSLENAYITLTARGRALEDGAYGETIRVMHINNASVVEGVVDGPKSIIVQ